MQISTFGTADFDHFSRARLRRPKTSIDKLRRLDTPRLQIGPPYKNYSTKKKYDCMYACESSVKNFRSPIRSIVGVSAAEMNL